MKTSDCFQHIHGLYLPFICVIAFMFLAVFPLLAQTNQAKPKYITWIKLKGKDKKLKTYFHESSDTSIQIMDWDYESLDNPYREISFGGIEFIQMRRKKEPGQGALFGALVGFGTGFLLGLASGDDKSGWFKLTAGEKALFGGITGILPGAMIGAIIGSIRTTIPLNPRHYEYQKNIEKLKSYSDY